MISGSYHISAQEWRYYSREKSLIHTLHLAELPTSRPGDTVEIASTNPAGTSNGGNNFHVPPIILPGGGGNGTFSLALNQMSTCFGSVGVSQNVLCQRNMDISTGPWAPTQMTITMIPKEGGWFFCHAEVQSDQRDLNYLGPTLSGFTPETLYITIDRFPVGPTASHIASTSSAISQQGLVDPTHWNAGFFTQRQNACWCMGFHDVGKGVPVYFTGRLLGNSPTAYLSAYMFKFAEL